MNTSKVINLLAVIGLLVPINLYAGEYDGVWTIDHSANQGVYHIVRQKNGTNEMLVANLWADIDGWDALMGTIQGNKVELQTVIDPDGDVVRAVVEFRTPTEATLTIRSCRECDLPIGIPLPVKKRF